MVHNLLNSSFINPCPLTPCPKCEIYEKKLSKKNSALHFPLTGLDVKSLFQVFPARPASSGTR